MSYFNQIFYNVCSVADCQKVEAFPRYFRSQLFAEDSGHLFYVVHRQKDQNFVQFCSVGEFATEFGRDFSSPMDAATPLANLDPTLRLNPKLANAKD
jgi:hypothetical protein